jgi:hypothetical protein
LLFQPSELTLEKKQASFSLVALLVMPKILFHGPHLSNTNYLSLLHILSLLSFAAGCIILYEESRVKAPISASAVSPKEDGSKYGAIGV